MCDRGGFQGTRGFFKPIASERQRSGVISAFFLKLTDPIAILVQNRWAIFPITLLGLNFLL
jgi:hypothetical protein